MKQRLYHIGNIDKPNRNRVIRVLALAFVLVLLVQGLPLAGAQERPIKLGVRMADVSLNKLAFIVAYEEEIFRKNGLEVELFITPGAAEVARANGVIIAEKFILKENGPT